MDLELLKYFIVTAEMEHVTNAANALHITQPSLSSAIKRLEKHLGLPLFKKDGRGIILTDHGYTYYRKVKHALEIIEEANDEIKTVRQNLEQTLTVFSPSLFNFPGLMDVLMYHYPNLRFSHVGMSYANLIESLKAQKMDFAICWASYLDPDLCYNVLMCQELVLYVGPQNAYYDREEITLDELNALPFIGSRAGEAKMDFLRYKMNQCGISSQSRSHATSAKDELSIIENSNFVSLQPEDASKVYAFGSKIRSLRIKDVSPIYANLYLIFNKDKQGQISKDVCRLIIDYFGALPVK